MDLSEMYKTDHGDLSGLDILLLGMGDDCAETFRKMLAGCGNGYRVSYADSMDGAIDILHKGCIDLLLFDLSRTGSDSLATLIRPALDLNKPYAIIALVDEKDEVLGIDAMKGGAEDYLIKGQTDVNLLARSVRQSIKCHHLRHRNLNLILVDRLTGLLTQRGFMMLSEQSLKVAQRYRQNMLLIFMDVDVAGRKKEKLDRVAFDKVLRGTATVMRHTFRGADILVSFGDGRFAGLAVGAPVDSIAMIRSRLTENLRKFNLEKSLPYDLSISTDIIKYDPEYPQSIEDMMEEAEALLSERRR